jgi:iron complex outermembrane receptor protein
LYGGKAIGGAVDLETDYIPRQLPAKLSNSKVFWKVELIAVRDRDFQQKVKLEKLGMDGRCKQL